jgi:hypothetical protein
MRSISPDFLDNMGEGLDSPLGSEDQGSVCRRSLFGMRSKSTACDMASHVVQGISLEAVFQNGNEEGRTAVIVPSREELLVGV